jgi:hypothetical protein
MVPNWVSPRHIFFLPAWRGERVALTERYTLLPAIMYSQQWAHSHRMFLPFFSRGAPGIIEVPPGRRVAVSTSHFVVPINYARQNQPKSTSLYFTIRLNT